jgi:hypothetical protein
MRDATDEETKRDWNHSIGQAAGMAEVFLNLRWAMPVSETRAFILSDNPGMIDNPLQPFRGLSHPEILVTFPLSPTLLLRMDNRHAQPCCQFYQAADPQT